MLTARAILTLGAEPLVPAWISVVLCVPTMLFIAAHVLAMHKLDMPASRRRIRTACGVLMLVLCPLLAYSVSILSPDDKRGFVLAWMSVMGLLSIIILLAGMDMLNNLRLHMRARAELRRQTREALSGEGLAIDGFSGAALGSGRGRVGSGEAH